MRTISKKDQTRQEFAQRFNQALAELGYSATESKRMRLLFGVSGQAVQKWAEGFALPTAARMPQIAQILGVRRAWLQDGEGPCYPEHAIGESQAAYAMDAPAVPLSSAEAKLLARYRVLNKEQQRLVEELLKQLAKN